MDAGSLTAEWTRAVINVDLNRVQELYQSNPELLWTPLEKESTNIETDYALLLAQLEQVQVLGNNLAHLTAIPFTLLDHLETDDEEAMPLSVAQQKRARLLYFLIENADADDLNNRSWGSCNNKTLHLASFLGQVQAVKQLMSRGASLNVVNDLGVSPKDVAQNDAISGSVKQEAPSSSKKSQTPRPNYATSDRFKQLRALAESQAAAEQKDTGDKRQKNQDDLRLQSRRQQDIALLAKRSPVKNNPLLKKFEQSNAAASTSSKAQKDTMSPLMKQKFGYLSPDDPESFPKRNSKVISSLKNKSYVSSSVFRQGDQERSPSPSSSSRGPSPAPPSRAASPLAMESIPPAPSSPPPQTPLPPLPPADDDTKEQQKEEKEEEEIVVMVEEDVNDDNDLEEEDADDDDDTNNTFVNAIPSSTSTPAAPTTTETIDSDDTPRPPQLSEDHLEEQDISSTNLQRRPSETVATEAEADKRSSTFSQQSAESPIDDRPLNRDSLPFVKNRYSAQSDSDSSEQWFDSYEEWVENGQQGRYSMKPRPRSEHRGPSSLRQSIVPQAAEPPLPITHPVPVPATDKHDDRLSSSKGNDDSVTEALAREIEQADIPSNGEASDDDTVRHEIEGDTAMQSMDETSIDSPTASASFSPRQRISVGADSVDTWPPPSTSDSIEVNDGKEGKKMQTDEEQQVAVMKQEEQTAPPSVSMDEEEDNDKKNIVAAQTRQRSTLHEGDYGHVAVSTTSRYATHRLDQPEKPGYQEFFESQPDSIKLELPAPNYTLNTAFPQSIYGKLYVRVANAQNILLPLPKPATYVRCVVNDGEYEYMSKYEVLGQNVLFEHECIINTRPDMIVTISLHVRLDDHVRPRTGLSKFFTSARKQLQTLNGYVHPEDGAIGQTRFALDHMMHACYQKTYSSDFDCFNSWYARSSKDRQRQQEDVLKVVGSLKVEMLYLPVSDPSSSVPKTLRECDLALRIRQWHETCWISGYLALRRQGTQLWERYYCRLIGSQLIAYASKEASAWKPLGQYEIADAVRLVAASDQVIITLVDLPDNRVFKEDTIVDDTGRGFFRLTFPDFYLDCVSDHAQESEEWVKMLKSMIGRVPLRVPFSV